jgi:hypothetical protein
MIPRRSIRLVVPETQGISQGISWLISASIDRRSEDVCIFPIIITELEFGNIERHIFTAHFVECANHAALENRPETFDGLSVDRADDILASGVVNSRVWIIHIERIVSRILIGAKQADFMRDGFADERGESGGIHIRDYARNHVTFPTDGADDWRFAGAYAAGSTASAAFIPMPVFRQTADESFIDFDNSAELINVLHQSDADAVAHIPSGFQGTKSHIAPNLASTYPLFASQHQMNDAEPITERLIRIFEYRPSNMRKAVAVGRALFALPMPFTGRKIVNGGIAATRATDALRPAPRDQVSPASLFVREQFFELRDCQLVDLRGLFCAGHGLSSEYERTLS